MYMHIYFKYLFFRADSVAWNIHKMSTGLIQCSLFLTKYKVNFCIILCIIIDKKRSKEPFAVMNTKHILFYYTSCWPVSRMTHVIDSRLNGELINLLKVNDKLCSNKTANEMCVRTRVNPEKVRLI